jgi:hypothetical protein
MKKIRIGKLVRVTIWSIGSIVILLIMLHLALPYVVNHDSVRAVIIETVSEALPGRFHFASLKPALLPTPHAVIHRVSYSEPARIDMQFSRGLLRPKLWPLFAGRLELDVLEIDRPEITLSLPSDQSKRRHPGQSLTHQAIKARIGGIFSAVADLAGHGRIEIANSRWRIIRDDRFHLELFQANLQAVGFDQIVQIDMSGASNLAQRLELRSRINMKTLNASADLHITGLMTGPLQSFLGAAQSPWLPATNADLESVIEIRKFDLLEARFAIQAPTLRIGEPPRSVTVQECKLAGTARWSKERLQVHINQMQSASPDINLSGTLTRPAASAPIVFSATATDLDLSSFRTPLLKLAGKIPAVKTICDIVRGGSVPLVKVFHSAPTWSAFSDMDHLKVEARLTNGRIQVPPELFLLDKVHGKVIWAEGRLLGKDVFARLGNSAARSGTLILGLADGSNAFALDTSLSADLTQLPAILKKLTGDPSSLHFLERLPPFSGHADGRLILGDRLDRIRATITAAGNVQSLDANVAVSAHLEDIPAPSQRVNISGKGDLGPQSLNWLAQWGNIADDYIPKSKLTVKHADVVRDSRGTFDIEADITAADDITISSVLQIQAPAFNLAKLHIRDADSDANITLKRPNRSAAWDLLFDGIVDRTTLHKLFRQDWIGSGTLKGHLQGTVNVQEPASSMLQGALDARDLKFQTPALGRVSISEAVLTAQKNLFLIPSAAIQWQDHAITLSGVVKVSPELLGMNLTLRADALNVDELMQVIEKKRSSPEIQWANRFKWPKLTGLVSVDIDDLALGGYRYVPMHADISLDKDRTIIDVTAANVCGISVPGRILISGDKAVLRFKPRAKKRVLAHTSSCLTSAANTERYEGIIDVKGDVSTQGAGRDDLIANLKGHASIRITDGRVYNIGSAGFLTNLLSYLSINQLLRGGAPDLSKNDFHYNSIETKLSIRDGMLQVEEGLLKSNSINLVTEGNYDVAADELKLNVLISPLTTLDWVIERIPIINRILKGTLVAVPVRVKGPAADPKVVPLSIEAMGSRVVGILKRALETPFKIVEPLLPEASD